MGPGHCSFSNHFWGFALVQRVEVLDSHGLGCQGCRPQAISIQLLVTLLLQSQLLKKHRQISHMPQQQFFAAIRSGRQLPYPLLQVSQ